MRVPSKNGFGYAPGSNPGHQANARIVLLVVVCFLLGIAVSAFWFRHSMKRESAPVSTDAEATPAVALSERTRAVLKGLNSPVQIRFYCSLDPATVSESVKAFAGRVDRLLAEYEREANGKLTVTRIDPQASATASAATADGIKPFNIDKGNACFLGIAVVQDKQKDSLPELSPEWEPALESDLTRALLHVVNATAAANPPPLTPKVDAAVIEEVKRALPNFDALSLEEGTRALRQAAISEFKAATQELQRQVKEAQDRVTQAQSNGSEAEQQAALKNLQQTQAEQSRKLQEIAEKSNAQVDALAELKKAPR